MTFNLKKNKHALQFNFATKSVFEMFVKENIPYISVKRVEKGYNS